MKLSEIPGVRELIPATVEWQDGEEKKEVSFFVKQVAYSEAGDLFTAVLAEGQKRNPQMIAELVWFDNENGERVQCPYAFAAALPATLGVLVHKKALDLNGFGGDATKN